MKQSTRLFLPKLQTLIYPFPFRNVSITAIHNPYSTAAATRNPVNPKRVDSKNNQDTLHKRISPLRNPNQSIVPVLDQWVREGKSVNDSNLRFIIKDLRNYRRYNHALQVSNWMSDKSFVQLTARDVALRLDLIAKVHGIEEAKNYFNGTSKKLRTLEVYGALLNCSARAKCVDKAEDVMQKMRELGFTSYALSYNSMLHLYCRTNKREKLDALLLEMEANNIKCDTYTYRILLKTYGGGGDIDGLEKILTKMESDPELDIDWMTYAIAAKYYLDAKLVDKALESLRKSEKLVGLSKKKNEAYSHILTLYTSAGKKEEVLRVWQECKMFKPTNRDYVSLLTSILKFNGIETAENIFKEWVDSNLTKDIRITNILISGFCRNGLMEKAESLLERVKSEKWHKPNSYTWFWLSYGYGKSNQMPKAVEAMESALLEDTPDVCWKAKKGTLAACLKYLKNEGDLERLNSFIETLKHKCHIPAKIHENVVDYVSGKCDIEDIFNGDRVRSDSEQVRPAETAMTKNEIPELVVRE